MKPLDNKKTLQSST